MKYTVTVGGESHRCQLFVGFAGKPEDDATPADLIACLKANPEARTEVLDALGEPPARRHLDVAAAEARASQAERALATVTAERDEARAKLAEAERLAAENERLWELDKEALDYALLRPQADALRAQLAKTEVVVKAARTDLRTADILIAGANAGAGGTTAERLEQATRGIREALRALDSPVVAGTASGGEGSPSNSSDTGGTQGKAPPAGGEAGSSPAPSSAGFVRYSCDCGETAMRFVPVKCRECGTVATLDRDPDDYSDDSPVGAAATAEAGHEAPARNRQPVEHPSDPATGTTRREPPETARTDGSKGAVAEPRCKAHETRGKWVHFCNWTAGHEGEHSFAPLPLRYTPVTPPDAAPDPQAPATRAEVEELRRRVERLERGPRRVG